VLPIGGLKEKLLAAHRGGIKTVLIPDENAKDLADIPDNVRNDMEVIPVAHMDDVLKVALVRPLEPISWDESKDVAPAQVADGDAGDLTSLTAH
jgi:ATP-dependent Lon protease